MSRVHSLFTLLFGLLFLVELHADGIALSADGLRWSSGVGAYGTTGAPPPLGLEVAQGGTIYIRYFTEGTAHITLTYSRLHLDSTKASPIGPATSQNLGDDSSRPVVLRITDIGTPKSRVQRIGGGSPAENWGSFLLPGMYNLHLGDRLNWLNGPLVITEKPKAPTLWAQLIDWLGLGVADTKAAPRYAAAPSPVADAGGTATLLAIGAVGLAWAHARLRR
jgi:hypothetical protein